MTLPSFFGRLDFCMSAFKDTQSTVISRAAALSLLTWVRGVSLWYVYDRTVKTRQGWWAINQWQWRQGKTEQCPTRICHPSAPIIGSVYCFSAAHSSCCRFYTIAIFCFLWFCSTSLKNICIFLLQRQPKFLQESSFQWWKTIANPVPSGFELKPKIVILACQSWKARPDIGNSRYSVNS